MPPKPKTNQPETPNEIQGRDLFQTPNYAVDMATKFIPDGIDHVWECAAGNGKIVSRLQYQGFTTLATDIRHTGLKDLYIHNFLTDPDPEISVPYCIITNPPFSLKYRFINKALEYNVPFGFLIPFGMCQQMAKLFMEYGCQGIVPTKRIDYITPNILDNIYKAQLKNLIEKKEKQKFKNYFLIPDELKIRYCDYIEKYNKIEEIPKNVLFKHTASQFHLFWITRFFNLENQLNFVELTKKMKENI